MKSCTILVKYAIKIKYNINPMICIKGKANAHFPSLPSD